MADLGKWASEAYRIEIPEEKNKTQEIESNGRK
jgi:endogenous inhibitor of DNA gyrase (YacG/DUF329 family)